MSCGTVCQLLFVLAVRLLSAAFLCLISESMYLLSQPDSIRPSVTTSSHLSTSLSTDFMSLLQTSLKRMCAYFPLSTLYSKAVHSLSPCDPSICHAVVMLKPANLRCSSRVNGLRIPARTNTRIVDPSRPTSVQNSVPQAM